MIDESALSIDTALGWGGSILTCPDCCADLRLKKNKFRIYSRVIGVEIPGRSDGVLFWRCPDCGHEWHRWPPDYRQLYHAAGFYMTMKHCQEPHCPNFGNYERLEGCPQEHSTPVPSRM